MDETLVAKGAFYELLSLPFRQTTRDFSETLHGGAYAEAVEDVCTVCGLDAKAVRAAVDELGRLNGEPHDPEGRFHALRRAYTRLFIGGFEPLASPFAGIWWSRKQGIPPVHMVNAEALAVARCMREAGVGRMRGKNVPLDRMDAELEFMQYLCARAAASEDAGQRSAACAAYGEFYRDHLLWFAHDMGARLQEVSVHPLYGAVGTLLCAFPENPL